MTPIRTILHQYRVSFRSNLGAISKTAYSNIAPNHATPSSPPRPVISLVETLPIEKTPPPSLNLEDVSYGGETKHPEEISPQSLNLEDVNYYGGRAPPSALLLKNTAKFMVHNNPTLLLSSPLFREFPISPVPEVAFLGRSNVGKSSLLNALIRQTKAQLAYVSRRPGRTRTMNAYGIAGVRKTIVREAVDGKVNKRTEWMGEKGLVVMDMPGYGKASREEWGEEVLKYMTKREQFKRAFVLIDAVHGVKPTDKQIIELLAAQQIPHQLIISKIDKIIPWTDKPLNSTKVKQIRTRIERTCRIIKESVISISGFEHCHPVILVCAAGTSVKEARRIGLNGVRWAVLEACGLLKLIETNPQKIPTPTKKIRKVPAKKPPSPPSSAALW